MIESGPKATRERLLAAAAQAISEYGYAATTLSRVAASLGLTKGAYAYHFPTKAKIADALQVSFYQLLEDCHVAAQQAFPQRDMHTFVYFLTYLGHRLAADPIARGAVTITFDLSTPKQHSAAMIQAMRDSIAPLIDNSREIGQIHSTRSSQFQAETAMALLLGSHFIGSRYPRPADESRLRFLRSALDTLGAADSDQIVDTVIATMTADRNVGAPPTYRNGVVAYPDSERTR